MGDAEVMEGTIAVKKLERDALNGGGAQRVSSLKCGENSGAAHFP